MKIKLMALFIFTILLGGCSSNEKEEGEQQNQLSLDIEKYIGKKNVDVKNENLEVEGFFEYALGENGGKISSFVRDYSDITLKREQLDIRMMSQGGEVILISLRGNGVKDMPVRTYTPVDDPNGPGSYSVFMEIMGVEEDDYRDPMVLKRGELVITNIDLKYGLIEGYFVQLASKLSDEKQENLLSLHGKFNLRGLVVQEKL